MTEYREALLDRMIRIYGFEHEVVIAFAKFMEVPEATDGVLEVIVKTHEECAIFKEEEED